MQSDIFMGMKEVLLVRDTRSIYILNVNTGVYKKVKDVGEIYIPTLKDCYSNLLSIDVNPKNQQVEISCLGHIVD